MMGKSGSLPKVDIQGDDVVIIIRPQKENGEWNGLYEIIQSVVEPTSLKSWDAYMISYTGLLMCLLPSYLREDEDFEEHYNDYVGAIHEDLVAELLEKHDVVGDLLNGKLH